MLSEKLKRCNEIYEICKNDTTDIEIGAVFDGAVISETPCKEFTELLKGKVKCIGKTENGEKLYFCSCGERCWFSVYDGWGVKDNVFYALKLGMLIDFKKSVTINEIKEELKNTKQSKGVYAAMSSKEKTKNLKTLIDLLSKTESFYENK